jgi:hypothetical protein
MCSLPLAITATMRAAFHLEERNKALSMTLQAEGRGNLCADGTKAVPTLLDTIILLSWKPHMCLHVLKQCFDC